MYFLPSFLEHHRAIGVEQFLFLDDCSIDGTASFLSDQPDCVVLRMPLRFGQVIAYKPRNRRLAINRAGILMKNEIPELLLRDKFVLYLDADEFLFLPPGVSSVRDVIARVECIGETSVGASVVEFFPHGISDIATEFVPRSLADLLREYPYFDASQLIRLRHKKDPDLIGDSKSMSLARHFCPDAGKRPIDDFLRRLQRPREFLRKPRQLGVSSRFKTPILLHNDTSFQIGSHRSSPPACFDILLTIGHFVFTSNLNAKIERALKWKSHNAGAVKYSHYVSLCDAMKRVDGSFVTSASVKFECTSQFLDHELMKW